SKTGQHRPNKYLAILDTVHLTPESGGHLNPPDSGGKKPSDSGVRRLGDKEDSVNLKKENQDFFGLPREERKQKTGEDFLPSNSPPSPSKDTEDLPRAAVLGVAAPDRTFTRYDLAQAAAQEKRAAAKAKRYAELKAAAANGGGAMSGKMN